MVVFSIIYFYCVLYLLYMFSSVHCIPCAEYSVLHVSVAFLSSNGLLMSSLLQGYAPFSSSFMYKILSPLISLCCLIETGDRT